MKKTILIASIIIVFGLAIFGVMKLTSDNSAVSDKTAATITTEASTASNTTDNKTEATTDNKEEKTTSSENKEVAKESTASKETVKGDVIVSIGSEKAQTEQIVTIPVSIEAVPKAGIGSCNFNIKYDSKVLEVVEILPGDITENISSTLEFANIESTGMVSYLFTSSNNGKDAITKPGVISNIKFKVKKDAQKGATSLNNGTAGAFGDTSLNKITATFNNGEITIK